MSDQNQNPEGAPSAPPAVPPFVHRNREALEKLMAEPMRQPFSDGPSLADEMAWRALGPEVHRLARRMLGVGEDASLETAFREGWERAVEECRDALEFREPRYERADFESWVRAQLRDR